MKPTINRAKLICNLILSIGVLSWMVLAGGIRFFSFESAKAAEAVVSRATLPTAAPPAAAQQALAAQENQDKWPSLERQLTSDKVAPSSALDQLIRDNQEFSVLHPQEANDTLGLPPWLRVSWRKANPDWSYNPDDPTGNYPRVLKNVYLWMLNHQDLKPGPEEPSSQPQGQGQTEDKIATIGTNLRVSGAQSTLRAESDIRVNYSDPMKIVAASNSGSGTQAQFYSTDGGATWGQTSLPLISPDAAHSDPTVDWTSDGKAWATALGLRLSNNLCCISQGRAYVSTNNGQTWTLDGTFSGSQTLVDKQMMWVDHSPTSLFKDNIYAIYHNGRPAFMNRRTSAGWQTPIQVSSFETTGTGVGGDVKTNSAGEVFGFWPDTGSGKIFVVKSTNGGASYSSPTQVATTFDTFDIGVPSFNRRRALIYVTAGAYRTASKNLVYAAWTDLSGESDCTLPGNEPGSIVISPCKTRIWFARSTDSGATWSPKVMINNPPSLNDQFNPWLVVDETSGNLGIIYYDTVGDPGRKKVDLWYQASPNDGAGWNPPVKVTTAQTDETASSADSFQFGDYNGLSGINGTFFPAWTDRRSGGKEEIWTAKLTDTFALEPFVMIAGATITAENCAPANNVIEPGETVTVNFSLQNTGSANLGNLTATLQTTGGVTLPSGSQTYGALTAGGSSVARSFTFTANGTCGSTLMATLQLQDGATSLGTVTFTFPLGLPKVTFSENFDGVTAPALPAGWTSTVATGSASPWVTSTFSSDTAPNNAFVNDPSAINDIRLDSPSLAITTASAQLTFRNNYNLEAGFDGGVLEISINGAAFTDILTAGGSFAAGGYNRTISTSFSSPIAGRQAWSDNSGGYVTTTVNLPAAAAGQNIKLRWRMGSDTSFGSTGWRIDTIKLTDGAICLTSCGGPLCPVIALTPASLPAGAITAAYNQTLTASGGLAPYSFTLSAGALPNGLALSSSGVLSGTPTQGGSFNLTIKAIDANGCLGTQSYSLVINCPAITLAPTTLPNGLFNTAYNQTLTTSGGVAPFSFAVTAGALPGGLTLSPGGVLAGTPSFAGTFNFTVTATDVNGCTGTRSYTITITVPAGLPAGFLYVLNDLTSGNQIYGYSLNEATGALTLLSGFPISTGGASDGLTSSERLTIDRANLRLYAINGLSNTVSAFSINPATGALTPLPFSPIRLDSGTWFTIAVHPSGSPLVVGDLSNRLLSYQITATTATAAAGSPYNTGSAFPYSAAFSQDGNFVYTGGGSGSSTIAGFRVNASTGVLTALAGSPFDSGSGNALAFAADAVGRLFATNFNTARVSVFTTASGLLSGVSGNPFVSGLSQGIQGLLHPNGFYLVADRSNRVGVYRISGSGSATTLAAVTGSPFAVGGTFTNALALNQAGTFLFAANGSTRNLTTFSVNATTGALTALSTQPTNTLGTSGLLTGMAYLPAPIPPCPTITNINPTSGPVGSSVTITGTGFTGLSAGAVKFSNNVTATFTVVNDTTITATVPSGAVTGPITISKTNCGDVQSANFTVTCPTITIAPAALPAGTVNAAYTQTLTASGGMAAYSFTLTAGTLPNGLTLSSGGVLSGTPTQSGSFSITIKATDANGCMGTQSYTLVINCPAITLVPATLPNGTINTAYNQTISASPSGSYTFTVTAGALPAGLSLNSSTGAITGTPTTAGTSNFTITALSFGPCSGSQAYTLTINSAPNAPRIVRAISASASPGGSVSIPIELDAQGNENALGFSLTFDPALLSNPQASLGADASGATLNFNSNQVAQGRLGLLLSLPTGQNFAAGTRQILSVSFTVAAGVAATSTPLGFTDQPVARELVDRNASPVTVSFTPGAITITAAQGYEADLAPRPNGSNNGTITAADWVQVGRFAAGVDTAANGSEFQRADGAPRETLGDGRITTADWVQAGRYAAGLDPVVAAGGPTSPVPSAQAVNAAANAPASAEAAITRGLRVGTSRCEPGRDCVLTIELEARGGENAAGLSLNFDPSQLRFQSASAGRDASGAVLNLNTSQITRGSIGLALALPAGQSLPAGTLQLVTLTFTRLNDNHARAIALGFTDQPVARELVDVNARSLPASYAISDGLTSIRAAANVSAASFSGVELASEAIASAFGASLAIATQAAETFPLPLMLAETQVLVRDSAGIERPAFLFFVSPTQVNYQIPPDTAPGSATVTIRSGDGAVAMGTLEIARVAPGLFTANASGQGAAAAMAVRVASDGGQSFEPVAVFDPAQSRYVSRPIDLGPESEQVVLLLFGTGLRHHGSLSNVTASIGGEPAQVDYAGPQSDFVGLDQINLCVPRSLIGRGEVEIVLIVDGKAANTVKANIR